MIIYDELMVERSEMVTKVVRNEMSNFNTETQSKKHNPSKYANIYI